MSTALARSWMDSGVGPLLDAALHGMSGVAMRPELGSMADVPALGYKAEVDECDGAALTPPPPPPHVPTNEARAPTTAPPPLQTPPSTSTGTGTSTGAHALQLWCTNRLHEKILEVFARTMFGEQHHLSPCTRTSALHVGRKVRGGRKGRGEGGGEREKGRGSVLC